MFCGTIKSLIRDRGFGFIKPMDHAKPDIFFHCSALTNAAFEDLQGGETVRYTEGQNRQGKSRAENIQVDGQ